MKTAKIRTITRGSWVVAMNYMGRPVVCPRRHYLQLYPRGLIGKEIVSSNSFDDMAKEAAHLDSRRTLH